MDLKMLTFMEVLVPAGFSTRISLRGIRKRGARRSLKRVEDRVCILRCVAGADSRCSDGESGFPSHVPDFRNVLVHYNQFSAERTLRHVHDEFFASIAPGYHGLYDWGRFFCRRSDPVQLFREQRRDSERTGLPEFLHANFKLAARRIFC